MRTLYNEVNTSFATFRQTSYAGLTKKVEKEVYGKTVIVDEVINVTIPADLQLDVSSSYRNPERNERIPGAARSSHMFGRAVDFRILPNTNNSAEERKRRAKAFYGLWLNALAGNSPTANMFQLEIGPNNESLDGRMGK